jgi:cell division protein FtsB
MARKAKYKSRGVQNKAGILWISVVMLILFTVVTIKGVGLSQKAQDLQTKEASLKAQIEAEESRTEEIAEFEKYTHTRKYIEDTAKDKLGLVYPGEIIFKNTDD